jgi:hypothetical protein
VAVLYFFCKDEVARKAGNFICYCYLLIISTAYLPAAATVLVDEAEAFLEVGSADP